MIFSWDESLEFSSLPQMNSVMPDVVTLKTMRHLGFTGRFLEVSSGEPLQN